MGITHQHHDNDAIEYCEIAYHAQNGLLLRAFDVGGANQFRGASKLCAPTGRRDFRDRFAAPYQRSRISLKPGASFGSERIRQ